MPRLTIKVLVERIKKLEDRVKALEPVPFEREPYQNMSEKAKREAMKRDGLI